MKLRHLSYGMIAILAVVVISAALTPRTAVTQPVEMDAAIFSTLGTIIPLSSPWDAF